MPKFLNPEFAGTQGIGIVLTKSSPQKQQRIVAISDDTSFRSFLCLPTWNYFKSIMLGIAQAKRVDALLPMIVSGLVDKADFALARIWLIETPNSHVDNKERFLRTVSQ